MTATLASNRARVGSTLTNAEARDLERRFVVADHERPTWNRAFARKRRAGVVAAIAYADAFVRCHCRGVVTALDAVERTLPLFSEGA